MKFEQWEIDNLREIARPRTLLILGEDDDSPLQAQSQDEQGNTRILYVFGFPGKKYQ